MDFATLAINVLEHFWKSSLSSAAELRAELLRLYPWLSKIEHELIQVVASNSREGKGSSKDQSCSSVICDYVLHPLY